MYSLASAREVKVKDTHSPAGVPGLATFAPKHQSRDHPDFNTMQFVKVKKQIYSIDL